VKEPKQSNRIKGDDKNHQQSAAINNYQQLPTAINIQALANDLVQTSLFFTQGTPAASDVYQDVALEGMIRS